MADKILIGPDLSAPLFSFTDADIRTCSCVLSSGLLMDELAIDEFSPVVYSTAYIRVRFAPSAASGMKTSDGKLFFCYPGFGFLDRLPYGTPIWYYSDGILIGKFYCKRVVRSGKTWFDIQAVSAIGILDGQTHNGGLYTGQTFMEVATDIIGGAASFSCADDVASIPVFNWLPKASRRSNLHQLLFVYGVVIKKDANGDMMFQFPKDGTPKIIPDDRIFVGGSIDYMTPANRVDITEHAFMQLPSDEVVTLFDNTDGSGVADHTTVDFRDAPIHDIAASSGLVVHESGVNHAVVSGTGVLTGRKYTHTTKIISMENGSADENKTVSVTDATLVSVANSEYVARRVLSFYSSTRKVSADMVVDGERPGDQISFNNPFDDPETAFLASMDISSSSFLRASCELITNYTPKWFGNNFSSAIVLTGSGTWNYTGKVRAVLISGGEGGSSGCDGTPSERDRYEVGPAGKGGLPGAPGKGGRILSVTLEINGSIEYNCGVGGIGGTNNGTTSSPGEDGTDTIFGIYTTANGERSQSGTINLFTGEVLATQGLEGFAGGDGASKDAPGGSVTDHDGNTYVPGEKGSDYTDTKLGTGYGGYGGGAAVGSNGENGGNGKVEIVNDVITYVLGGKGGNGANAVSPPDAEHYGTGGNAGHGGGGGGQVGDSDSGEGNFGMLGLAGKGSNGSKGGDGCIIVYLQ